MTLIEISNNVIKNNKLKFKRRLRSFNNPTDYFNNIFTYMDYDDLNKYIIKMLEVEDFKEIVIKYLRTILSLNKETANKAIEYLINSGESIEEILLYLKNKDEIISYCCTVRNSVNNLHVFSDLFIERNDTLFKLSNKIKNDIYTQAHFEFDIIYPLSYYDGGDYLYYVLKMLNIDIDSLEYLKPEKRGNYGFCFKDDKYVVKLATENKVWDIPMHYRINDFIVRRKFGKAFISITPLGDVESVTNQDIKDTLKDLEDSDILVTDNNYANNFAVIDYEIPSDTFRDVEGIREYIVSDESESFKKKKVKLIDQDYLFKKTDQDIIYTHGYTNWK